MYNIGKPIFDRRRMSNLTWGDVARIIANTKRPKKYYAVMRPSIYRWFMIYKHKKWSNKFLAWEATHK
jgi:hypothetical protein